MANPYVDPYIPMIKEIFVYIYITICICDADAVLFFYRHSNIFLYMQPDGPRNAKNEVSLLMSVYRHQGQGKIYNRSLESYSGSWFTKFANVSQDQCPGAGFPLLMGDLCCSSSAD